MSIILKDLVISSFVILPCIYFIVIIYINIYSLGMLCKLPEWTTLGKLPLDFK